MELTRDEKEKCVFDKGNKCGALTKKDCEGCNFYKTKDQLINGRKVAIKCLKKKGTYKALSEQYKLLKDVNMGV